MPSRPPVFAARFRRQALYDLPLQHAVHILNPGCVLQQVKDEGRGDVVGQVAHDPQGPAVVGEAAIVKCEGVCAVQSKTRVNAEGGQQRCREIAIQLDGVQTTAARQQRGREGAEPRPDFHEMILLTGGDGLIQARDHARIAQEVLSEAPAWRAPGLPVSMFSHGRIIARRSLLGGCTCEPDGARRTEVGPSQPPFDFYGAAP